MFCTFCDVYFSIANISKRITGLVPRQYGGVVGQFLLQDSPTSIVRALNVTKGHTFSLLDKSKTFGTDDLHVILFQYFDGSNLRF